MSATVVTALSSTKMGAAARVWVAFAILTQSASVRLPVRSFWLSTRASAERSRWASCSLLISREKMATALPDPLATLEAILRAKAVFPTPGRAAMRMRSDLLRPVIMASRAR